MLIFKFLGIYFSVELTLLLIFSVAEFEKESQNDAKMLMNYLSKLFDDTESVRIAYELIISLARLNRNGLLELSKMLDIFSRTDEYKSDISKEEEKLNEI